MRPSTVPHPAGATGQTHRCCCRSAARTTTRSRAGSPPAARNAMTRTADDDDAQRTAVAAACVHRAAAVAVSGCRCGGGSNPLDNPADVAEPARTRRARSCRSPTSRSASTRSSWRSCRSTCNGAIVDQHLRRRRAATTTPTAPAALCASWQRRRPIDLTDPANTPDVDPRQRHVQELLLGAGLEVVIGSPTQSRLLAKPMLLNVLHGGGLVFADRRRTRTPS